MGKVKIREIDKKKIGTFKNMQTVIDNWKKLDKGCVTQSRWDYIQLHLDGKYHVWDHNVALVWLFDEIKAESYLEVGVLTCGSMVHAFAAKTVKHIVGIDAFTSTYAGIKYIKNKNAHEICQKQANKFRNINKNVNLIRSHSQPALAKMKEQFDIILVDGDHSEQGARNDLKLARPLAKKAIVFDDIHHQSHVYLEDVAYKFAATHELEITINHQPPGTVIFWIEK